jgi:hypothetical protein
MTWHDEGWEKWEKVSFFVQNVVLISLSDECQMTTHKTFYDCLFIELKLVMTFSMETLFFIVNLWVTKTWLQSLLTDFHVKSSELKHWKKINLGASKSLFNIWNRSYFEWTNNTNSQNSSKIRKNHQKKVRKYRCDRISRHRTSWDCRQVIYYRYPISDIEYSEFSSSII